MSLRNYDTWLKLDEAVSSGKSFQFLESYINAKGVQKEINYNDILNDPTLKENEGGISGR